MLRSKTKACFGAVVSLATVIACGSSGGDGGSGASSSGGTSGGGTGGLDYAPPGTVPDGGPVGSTGGSGSGTGGSSGTTGSSIGGPQFPGTGTTGAGAPLEAGIAPETSGECVEGTPTMAGGTGAMVADGATLCFYSADDPMTVQATIEQVVEVVGDQEWVHIRLTLNPDFVDNTYGANAVGWDQHTFRDLVGSDHAQLIITDTEGNVVLDFRIDYISEDMTSPSGYASLGVSGGEGRVEVGDAAWILATATSIDRNFNGCGLDTFTTDSPVTDENYTPDPTAPEWDYRVVYEVWISMEAFGDLGFGQAIIENVHASPSKADSNTIEVMPGPCPPDWGCQSSVASEGRCL